MKEFTPPPIPEDLNTAIKSGKVRVSTHIISTISDERGIYATLTLCMSDTNLIVKFKFPSNVFS